MNLIYHRDVQRDVTAVLDYYDAVGGPALGDAFSPSSWRMWPWRWKIRAVSIPSPAISAG